LLTTRPDDPNAVIATQMDRPVVQQERVDLIRENGARFITVPSERLSRPVGAGHDERASGIAHDQMRRHWSLSSVDGPKLVSQRKPTIALADRQAAMRKAIAAAMAHFRREIPHYYLGAHIDMSRAMT
jgi:hypothetical protein